MFDLICPGGKVIFIGIPLTPFPMTCRRRRSRKRRSSTCWATPMSVAGTVAMLASGKVDVTPLITDVYDFADSVHAFEVAANMPAGLVKIQIDVLPRIARCI